MQGYSCYHLPAYLVFGVNIQRCELTLPSSLPLSPHAHMQTYGVPQFFGIYYAMGKLGIAVILLVRPAAVQCFTYSILFYIPSFCVCEATITYYNNGPGIHDFAYVIDVHIWKSRQQTCKYINNYKPD